MRAGISFVSFPSCPLGYWGCDDPEAHSWCSRFSRKCLNSSWKKWKCYIMNTSHASWVITVTLLHSDLFFSELNFHQRPYVGEDLPPGPALHATVLLNVLLDATDGHVLDLLRERERGWERVYIWGFTFQHYVVQNEHQTNRLVK